MTNPEKQEQIQSIEVEVGFGERHVGFHRDPNMPKHEGGFIFTDWTGESPTSSYYVVETDGKIGWGVQELNLLDEVTKKWINREIDEPELDSPVSTLVKKWERGFDRDTGILQVKGVNRELAPYLLRIKAQSITVIQDIPLE